MRYMYFGRGETVVSLSSDLDEDNYRHREAHKREPREEPHHEIDTPLG